MTDKLGRDCTEFQMISEGRIPVLDAARKWAMISDLYGTGWSYWLIAQFCGMTAEDMREALASNGESLNRD